MSDEQQRGVEWARKRAQAAQARVKGLLAHRTKITVGTVAAASGGVALAMVIGVWLWLFWGLPQVPNADALWSMNRQQGMTFLDSKGRVLGVRGAYYGERVRLTDLPAYVPQAFLAIEDQRFYEHKGIDRQAVLRAALSNLLNMRTVQGGSTITQQLCKNLFLTPDQTIRRKLQEMILAQRVEQKLTKDEILELYLNRIFMGERAYGIDAASRIYFGKPARAVTVAEAAMLAGLPKAPSAYDPADHYERSIERQRVVLQSMISAGVLTRAQAGEAAAEKIAIVKNTSREVDMGYAFDMAADEANKLLGDERTPDLVVHITVDPDMQTAAAKAIQSIVPAPKQKGAKHMEASLVSIDQEGGIRAMIGGRSYTESKFNRATQAKRQPGSAFKTFVYAAAFENGYGPDTVRYDEPISISGWQPQNYYGDYRGAVSLRSAFAASINTVAALVGHEVGEQRVAALAHRFGITSSLDAVPSLALGSSAVSPLEITQAYSTLMREGKRIDAYLVQSIENASGVSLYARPAVTPKQAYDPELAHLMSGMLARVVQAGTGTAARLGDRQAVGKTGTSSDWRDAWFVGYTADYTTGVWVGYDDNSEMPHVSGATLPSTIWSRYMTAASKGLPAKSIPGFDLPGRSERDLTLASFYDALSEAFGFGGDDDDDNDSQ